MECFLLNRFNLAAIFTDEWEIPAAFPAAASVSEEFASVRSQLPPWVLVVCINGLPRHPEEKIAYEEEALKEAAAECSITKLPTSIVGLPGTEKSIVDMLRAAWPKDRTYWKFAYKGSCQDLFFRTTLNKTADFTKIIGEAAFKYDYAKHDIGYYIQPMVYGGNCHFECNFIYNRENAVEVNNVKDLYADGAEAVLNAGGFFSTPYGNIADMVFNRSVGYTDMLKRIKKMLDPNNIMSPGRLCF
jgi:hypothetical protein